jgi:ABC-type nitrate/sulfonate/bicarbonate transport system substrate-binding protein
LATKKVDAVQLWQPFVAQLVSQGYGYTTPAVNLRDSQPMGDLNSVLVVNRSFETAHPQVVDDVLKACLEAAHTMQTHPALWVSTIHQFAPNLSNQVLKRSIRHITFLSKLSLKRLNGMAALEYQLGIAKKNLSGHLGPYINVSFLHQVTGVAGRPTRTVIPAQEVSRGGGAADHRLGSWPRLRLEVDLS